MKLEKGAPVRVRLHTGEVVEAAYECESEAGFKTHLVDIGLPWCLRTSSKNINGECRFVGNPCVLVPVGVSV